MARSFTDANTKTAVTTVSVQVYDDISAWKDLCDLDGESRVQSLAIKCSTSNGRYTISCNIIDIDSYRNDSKSLDPADSGSNYNVCGSSGTDPLLGAYHKVRIYLTKNSQTAQLMFTGFVGQSTISPSQSVKKKDIFPVTFVGEMQTMVDHHIVVEEALVYADTYLSIGQARDVLSQIQYDYGHTPNIVIEDTDLNYYVYSYEVSDTNIYNAIHRPVSAIGHLLIEKFSQKLAFDAGSAEFTEGETVTGSAGTTGKVISWVVENGTFAGTAKGQLYLKDCDGDFSDGEALTGSSTGVAVADGSLSDLFRIAVVDPDRTNTTPDIDLGQQVDLVKFSYSEANVRTWVQVYYKDRTTGKMANVISSSATALATYGIPNGSGGRLDKKMRIVEKDGSWIDTRAEAQLEADYALSDVTKPWPGASVTIPWLVLGLEVGDLLRFDTDTEADIDISVSDVTWSIDAKNTYGKTTVRGTLEGRVGNVGYWLNQSREDFTGSIIKNSKELKGPFPITPTNHESESVFGDMADGSSAPVLHTRWQGTRDWRTTSYRLDTIQAESMDSGTVTSGNKSVLTDSTATWIPFSLIGNYVYISGETRGGNDEIRRIIYNDETTLRVDDDFITTLTIAAEYSILRPISEWTSKYVDRRPAAQVEGLPEGKYIISRVMAVPRGYRR